MAGEYYYSAKVARWRIDPELFSKTAARWRRALAAEKVALSELQTTGWAFVRTNFFADDIHY